MMCWTGKPLRMLFRRVGRDSRWVCVFSLDMDTKGSIWYFKGSQLTNMLRLALEILGNISKIENLSLYFAAYMGNEQFWVSGNILLNGWAERILLKVKNPVKRSATSGWGAWWGVCPEGTGASPQLPHTYMVGVEFLEFLQWVGALVFSCRQHINGKKVFRSLVKSKFYHRDLLKISFLWVLRLLANWHDCRIKVTSPLWNESERKTTNKKHQLISQICLVLLFKMSLSF